MTTRAALWQETYGPGPESIAQVRADLRCTLRGAGFDEDVADTVVLLASELATNAVQHGQGRPPRRIEVRLITASTGLYVEVADNNRQMPQPRRARDSDTGGRGLLLLAQLGQKWGVTLDAGPGKHTWVLVEAALPEHLRTAAQAARRHEPACP
jgi:anti-sigma regulatory factor (Ser/Thr protein kinase)